MLIYWQEQALGVAKFLFQRCKKFGTKNQNNHARQMVLSQDSLMMDHFPGVNVKTGRVKFLIALNPKHVQQLKWEKRKERSQVMLQK